MSAPHSTLVMNGAPFVTRPARQYTDEQVIEAAVAVKLNELLPASKVAAAQAEAIRAFHAGECTLNPAIELAVANAIPASAIVRAVMIGATAAMYGVKIPQQVAA